ncbi:Sec1-like protein [Cyathus striatus]|nr:Sec1-like protein [Cyathus striatus]
MATENNVNKDNSVDSDHLKEVAKKDLVDALNSVNGAKTLVLDPALSGPLGLVTEVALLKHHGVDKMFWLEPGPLSSTTTNIVYLCRPFIKHAKIIADQIKRHSQESRTHTYTVLLVPRTSTLMTRILEEEGVLGDVTISSYNLQFIPIADDTISLERENAFKELWVDGDESVIFDSAQALVSFQQLYGGFPRIIGKGDYAHKLCSMLTRQSSQQSDSFSEPVLSTAANLDSLIILDRRVDMITPMLTQLTYEGLLDELVGIRNSQIEVPAYLLNPTPAVPTASTSSVAPSSTNALKKDQKKKHHLTSATDPLLADIRDLNFSYIGRKLNQVARRLDDDYKSNLQTKNVAQLRDFVGKLGGLQSEHQALRLHTGLSEIILPLTRTEVFNKSLEIQQNLLASFEISTQISAIEDLIAQGADVQTVLRLLCLASIISGGIKAKNLESIKREVLQAYGYDYLPLLLSLATHPLSILLPNPLPASTQTSVANLKFPFPSIRKSLRLLIDDHQDALDECIAQKGGVISNPAEKERTNVDGNTSTKKNSDNAKVQAHPIVGWKGFEDAVALIPGETFDIVVNNNMSLPTTSRTSSTTTMVFFLGGCTYTEIAALRWMGRQNQGRNFLIATTDIINGASIMDGIARVRKPVDTKDASAYTKAATEKPARKTKSGGTGARKKLSPFNKFMQTEMARLKEDEPDMAHKDRFKLATSNWKNAKENPNKAT